MVNLYDLFRLIEHCDTAVVLADDRIIEYNPSAINSYLEKNEGIPFHPEVKLIHAITEYKWLIVLK